MSEATSATPPGNASSQNRPGIFRDIGPPFSLGGPEYYAASKPESMTEFAIAGRLED